MAEAFRAEAVGESTSMVVEGERAAVEQSFVGPCEDQSATRVEGNQ